MTSYEYFVLLYKCTSVDIIPAAYYRLMMRRYTIYYIFHLSQNDSLLVQNTKGGHDRVFSLNVKLIQGRNRRQNIK